LKEPITFLGVGERLLVYGNRVNSEVKRRKKTRLVLEEGAQYLP